MQFKQGQTLKVQGRLALCIRNGMQKGLHLDLCEGFFDFENLVKAIGPLFRNMIEITFFCI